MTHRIAKRFGIASHLAQMCAITFFAMASIGGAAAQEAEGVYGPRGLTIDGWQVRCGRAYTLVVPDFGDYGAAMPGIVFLDPDKLAGLPTPVKLYVYAHECAHQFVGADETAADCMAAMMGRREGWLDRSGLDQICRFVRPFQATGAHLPGPERCQRMRACFAEVGLRDRETVGFEDGGR